MQYYIAILVVLGSMLIPQINVKSSVYLETINTHIIAIYEDLETYSETLRNVQHVKRNLEERAKRIVVESIEDALNRVSVTSAEVDKSMCAKSMENEIISTLQESSPLVKITKCVEENMHNWQLLINKIDSLIDVGYDMEKSIFHARANCLFSSDAELCLAPIPVIETATLEYHQNASKIRSSIHRTYNSKAAHVVKCAGVDATIEEIMRKHLTTCR